MTMQRQADTTTAHALDLAVVAHRGDIEEVAERLLRLDRAALVEVASLLAQLPGHVLELHHHPEPLHALTAMRDGLVDHLVAEDDQP